MGIERARVLEVHSRGVVRTGYLLDDRLVLTAGAGPAPAEVRPGGTATWLVASPVWSTPAGVSVLELGEPGALMMPPCLPPWGRLTGRRPVAVTAMGFAPAPAPARWARDPVYFFGHVAPPEDRWMVVSGGPTGAGMTGAALFAGAELVGVLGAGGRAVPVSVLAAEPGFVALVGGGCQLVLADVRAAAAFPIL